MMRERIGYDSKPTESRSNLSLDGCSESLRRRRVNTCDLTASESTYEQNMPAAKMTGSDVGRQYTGTDYQRHHGAACGDIKNNYFRSTGTAFKGSSCVQPAKVLYMDGNDKSSTSEYENETSNETSSQSNTSCKDDGIVNGYRMSSKSGMKSPQTRNAWDWASTIHQRFSNLIRPPTDGSSTETGSLFLVRPSGQEGMWKAYRHFSGKSNVIKIIRTSRSQEYETPDPDGSITETETLEENIAVTECDEYENKTGNKSPSNISEVDVLTTNNHGDFFDSHQVHSDQASKSKRRNVLDSNCESNTYENNKRGSSNPCESQTKVALTKKQSTVRRTRGEILKMKQMEWAAMVGGRGMENPVMAKWTTGISQADRQSFSKMEAMKTKSTSTENDVVIDPNVDKKSTRTKSRTSSHSSEKNKSDNEEIIDSCTVPRRSNSRLIDHLQAQESKNQLNSQSNNYADNSEVKTDIEASSCNDIRRADAHTSKSEGLEKNTPVVFTYESHSLPNLKACEDNSQVTEEEFKHLNQGLDTHKQFEDTFSKLDKPVNSNRRHHETSSNLIAKRRVQTSSKGIQVKLDKPPERRDSSCQYSPQSSISDSCSHGALESDHESTITNASTLCSNCKSFLNSKEVNITHNANSPKILPLQVKELSLSETTLSEYVSGRGFTVWESPNAYYIAGRNEKARKNGNEHNSDLSCISSTSVTQYEDVNTCCNYTKKPKRLFRRDSPPPPKSSDTCSAKPDREYYGPFLDWQSSNEYQLVPIHSQTVNMNYNHSSPGQEMKKLSKDEIKSLPSPSVQSKLGSISSMRELHEMVESAKMRTHNIMPRNSTNSNAESVNQYQQKALVDEGKTSAFIGEYLLQLWKNQCLCDVQVKVGGDIFMAHKLVMAAFSEVFCPPSPKTLASVSFEIPDSSPEAVYEVLHYLYTSVMELKDEMLAHIMSAALFMGIQEIVDIVREILSKPTMENKDLYAEIKRKFGLPIGLEDYRELFEENFLEMIQARVFMDLHYDDLQKLLSDPNVMVETEVDVIKAIANWVGYNPLNRMDFLPSLLKLVNFECIHPEMIAYVTEEFSYLFQTPEAAGIICNAYRFHALKNIPGSEDLLYDEDLVGSLPTTQSQSVFNETRREFLKNKMACCSGKTHSSGNTGKQKRRNIYSKTSSSESKGANPENDPKKGSVPRSVYQPVPDYRTSNQPTYYYPDPNMYMNPMVPMMQPSPQYEENNVGDGVITGTHGPSIRYSKSVYPYSENAAYNIYGGYPEFAESSRRNRSERRSNKDKHGSSKRHRKEVVKLRGYSPSNRRKSVSFKDEEQSPMNNNAISPKPSLASTDFDDEETPRQCWRSQQSSELSGKIESAWNSSSISSVRKQDFNRVKGNQGDPHDFRSSDSFTTGCLTQCTDANCGKRNEDHRTVLSGSSSTLVRNGTPSSSRTSFQETEPRLRLKHIDQTPIIRSSPLSESNRSSRSCSVKSSSDWDKLSENMGFFSPGISDTSFDLENNTNNSHNSSISQNNPANYAPMIREVNARQDHFHFDLFNNKSNFLSSGASQSSKLHTLTKEEIDELLSDCPVTAQCKVKTQKGLNLSSVQADQYISKQVERTFEYETSTTANFCVSDFNLGGIVNETRGNTCGNALSETCIETDDQKSGDFMVPSYSSVQFSGGENINKCTVAFGHCVDTANNRDCEDFDFEHFVHERMQPSWEPTIHDRYLSNKV